VMNHTQLFYPGSGCCNGFPCSAFCRVGFSFTVLTSVGELYAGVITYGLTFNNHCAKCSSTSSFGALNCPART
jgi:hypothetical protein